MPTRYNIPQPWLRSRSRNGAPYAGTLIVGVTKLPVWAHQSWNIVTYNPATQLFDTDIYPGAYLPVLEDYLLR